LTKPRLKNDSIPSKAKAKQRSSRDGDGAFALVAFLHGATPWLNFNMLEIFHGTKEQ
jgi:hypothetical protein